MSAAPSESTARRTRWAAVALLVWLALLVLGSGFAAAVLLSVAEDYANSAAFQIVLCLTGGTLGASMLALLSAGERIARGWSFGADALASGERRFHARLAPLLALQPILGAAVGMLLLLALSAGSVMLMRLSEGTTFDPMGLLLASSLAGLLARGLLARLRDAADALFGARISPMALPATPPALPSVPVATLTAPAERSVEPASCPPAGTAQAPDPDEAHASRAPVRLPELLPEPTREAPPTLQPSAVERTSPTAGSHAAQPIPLR